MSIFSKYKIKQYIKEEKIKFSPEITDEQLQPSSVDLRLGCNFYLPKTWTITQKGRKIIKVKLTKPNINFTKIELKESQYFEVAPGEFIIGETYERVEFNSLDYMAVLYPRSSINRRGLSIDLTGIVDTGYKGKLFIPIKNQTSQIIRIKPKERFITLVFYELNQVLKLEDSKMHGKNAPKYHNADNFVGYIPDKKT